MKINLHPAYLQRPGIYVYIGRCSKDEEQEQREIVTGYLERIGLHPDKWVKAPLSEMLDAMKEGDTIVIASLTRLSIDSIAECATFINENIRERKLRLIIAGSNIDIDCTRQGNATEAQLALLDAMADFEKSLAERRAEEAIKKRARRIEDNATRIRAVAKKAGGQQCDYDTTFSRKNGVLANPTNKVVMEMFKQFDDEHPPKAADYKKCAAMLNDMGVKTSQGMDFNYSRLRAVYLAICRALKRKEEAENAERKIVVPTETQVLAATTAEKDKSNDTNRPPTDQDS